MCGKYRCKVFYFEECDLKKTNFYEHGPEKLKLSDNDLEKLLDYFSRITWKKILKE